MTCINEEQMKEERKLHTYLYIGTTEYRFVVKFRRNIVMNVYNTGEGYQVV